MRTDDPVPIGFLAKRTGVAVSAIRYYEERGLISARRNASGQRQFQRSDLRRLSFIIVAQQLGFTLAQIRQQLQNLPDERTPTKRDWEKISRSFAAQLDKKIRLLTQLRDNLDGCIGCGCLSLKNCKLYNPGDEIAREGPGPRKLLDGVC